MGFCKPYYRLGKQRGTGKFAERAFDLAKLVSFTPQQVAQLYGAPSGFTGKGVRIALLELVPAGFSNSDLEEFMPGLSKRTTAYSVDGASNSPGTDADTEVLLDIEVAGAVAPDAAIDVYFAPNTEQGYIDGITKITASRRNLVASTSWGAAEDQWSVPGGRAMNSALQDAALLGISWFAAAGDNGSGDSEIGNHVDFPASSPWMIGCGGTRLVANSGAITSETVWNDGSVGGSGGGGVSTVFARPSWQKACYATAVGSTPLLLTGRGVPDVTGNADPDTGYQITGGIVGGTSAVAPLWAGMIALLIEENGGKPLGPFYEHIYGMKQSVRSQYLNPVTSGNNGFYEATWGWNACAGVGSPRNLLGLLK